MNRNNDSIEDLYQSRPYLEAYSRHTDLRVLENPEEAVGGAWDEIGKLQFSFLKEEGLLPSHRLLDFGCGTLRGGKHFIRYLDERNYVGVDISSAALDYARILTERECLSDKNPIFVLNNTAGSNFFPPNVGKFDFILAQSVFTHLPADHIEQCFFEVRVVLKLSGRFYFTYFDGEGRLGLKDFAYPFSFFAELANRNDILIRKHIYDHPRGQKMCSLALSF